MYNRVERPNGSTLFFGNARGAYRSTDNGATWSLLNNGLVVQPIASLAVDGDVVFAGYGLTVPDGAGRGYNSYDGLNVSNKIVLVLRYVRRRIGLTELRARWPGTDGGFTLLFTVIGSN